MYIRLWASKSIFKSDQLTFCTIALEASKEVKLYRYTYMYSYIYM